MEERDILEIPVFVPPDERNLIQVNSPARSLWLVIGWLENRTGVVFLKTSLGTEDCFGSGEGQKRKLRKFVFLPLLPEEFDVNNTIAVDFEKMVISFMPIKPGGGSVVYTADGEFLRKEVRSFSKDYYFSGDSKICLTTAFFNDTQRFATTLVRLREGINPILRAKDYLDKTAFVGISIVDFKERTFSFYNDEDVKKCA